MNNLEIIFVVMLLILIFFMSDISNYIKNSKNLYIELFQNPEINNGIIEGEEEENVEDEVGDNVEDEVDDNVEDEVGDNVEDEVGDDENNIIFTNKNIDTHDNKTSVENEMPEPSYSTTNNGFELISQNFDGNINLYSPRINKRL